MFGVYLIVRVIEGKVLLIGGQGVVLGRVANFSAACGDVLEKEELTYPRCQHQGRGSPLHRR